VIQAFRLAVTELFEPQLRRVVLLAIALAAAAFVALWAALGWLIVHTTLFEWSWLDYVLDILGSVAALALTWILFPAIVLMIVSLFLDGVVEAIERRHYPDLPPAPGVPTSRAIAAALRLGLVALALNLLLLPLYFLLPGLNFALFWAVNGYLLGREYFELVALRRLPPATARTMRHAYAGRVFLAGVVIAFLLTIPFLNLAAPVIGAAFMLHLFEAWRRSRIGLTNLKG
jgi:CysZ protein